MSWRRRSLRKLQKSTVSRKSEGLATYGLAKTIDLSCLKEKELIQIAVGVHQVQFHFDADICISVENTFFHYWKEESWRWNSGDVLGASSVLALIGNKVTDISVSSPDTLWLDFSNEHRLAILDDSRQYESFTITWPGTTIVV